MDEEAVVLNENDNNTATTSVCHLTNKQTIINPEPNTNESDSEVLEEYLSPRRLKEITGKNDLETVTELEMVIDSERIALGNFGSFLPNLCFLNLSNSIIERIRDLGTGLGKVQALWMSQCCLECLHGIGCMIQMKELYLSFNNISDISPLSMMENLEILDLEGNQIDDTNSFSFLTFCRCLSSLNLEGNPVCSCEDYKRSVKDALPHLKYLNDLPVSSTRKMNKSEINYKFDDDWQFIDNILKEINDKQYDPTITNTTEKPLVKPKVTNIKRSGIPVNVKPSDKRKNQPALMTKSGVVILSKGSDGNAYSKNRPESVNSTSSSSYTLTQSKNVVCGDIGQALRKHKKENSQNKNKNNPDNLKKTEISDSDKVYGKIDALNKDCENALNDLQSWRKHYKESCKELHINIDHPKLNSRQIHEAKLPNSLVGIKKVRGLSPVANVGPSENFKKTVKASDILKKSYPKKLLNLTSKTKENEAVKYVDKQKTDSHGVTKPIKMNIPPNKLVKSDLPAKS